MAVHLTTGYPLKQGSTEIQLANLQQVVTSLIDELGHILYNLDSGNVLESATVKHLKAGSVTAEAISQEYREEVKNEIDGSAMEITQKFEVADGRLLSEINNTKTELDGKITENKSLITQTAIDIRAEVSEVQEGVENNEASIEMNSNAIKNAVTKTMSYGQAASGSGEPTSETNKDKLYFDETDKQYYYYDELNKKWEKTDTNSIYSAFIQTADGFELNGKTVKISGDLITKGTIKGGLIIEVSEQLKIGDGESKDESKSISFADGASIYTCLAGGPHYDGIAISSNGLYIYSKPDMIRFVNPDNTSSTITLEEYVQNNAVALYA